MSELKPLFYKVFPDIVCHFLVRIRVVNFNITALTNFFRPSHTHIYIYTYYKTTLRVIRRLCGGVLSFFLSLSLAFSFTEVSRSVTGQPDNRTTGQPHNRTTGMVWRTRSRTTRTNKGKTKETQKKTVVQPTDRTTGQPARFRHGQPYNRTNGQT